MDEDYDVSFAAPHQIRADQQPRLELFQLFHDPISIVLLHGAADVLAVETGRLQLRRQPLGPKRMQKLRFIFVQ